MIARAHNLTSSQNRALEPLLGKPLFITSRNIKPLFVLFSVELAKNEFLFYDMYTRETVPNPARLQTPQMSKSFWGFLRRARVEPSF